MSYSLLFPFTTTEQLLQVRVDSPIAELRQSFGRSVRRYVTAVFVFFAFIVTTSATAGVPEPDVVFYGHMTRSPLNTAYVPAGVTWSLSGNAETLTVSQTTVVSVNGETFYLTRIPFETRQLADHTPLPAAAADAHDLVLPLALTGLTPHAMTVIESILHDLQGLSNRALVDVADYVHRLSDSARKVPADVLRATHGCLNEANGRAFEEARTQGILLDSSVISRLPKGPGNAKLNP